MGKPKNSQPGDSFLLIFAIGFVFVWLLLQKDLLPKSWILPIVSAVFLIGIGFLLYRVYFNQPQATAREAYAEILRMLGRIGTSPRAVKAVARGAVVIAGIFAAIGLSFGAVWCYVTARPAVWPLALIGVEMAALFCAPLYHAIRLLKTVPNDSGEEHLRHDDKPEPWT